MAAMAASAAFSRGRVAEVPRDRAERCKWRLPKPGPEAFQKHVGAQKGAVNVQHQRLHLGHPQPFTAKTQPSLTSSGGVRHSPRATDQAASTLGT